jgi:carbon monoxide dehydrogenase subunit G
MKLENEFTVPASVEAAWGVLLDVERVAPCLPGATIDGAEGDVYSGTMKIKVGPITTSYKGTVKIEEADEAARRAVMRAQARDSRGQGTAAATITSTMEEVEGGTRVHVETDMRVTGPAAQFGRGVMQDVSAKLMGRFADCLAEKLTGDKEEAPTHAAAPEAAAEETTAPGEVAESAPSASSGISSAEPVVEAPSASSGTSSAEAPKATEARPTDDVLDLGEAAGGAVLKRAIPVVAGVVALLVLLRLIRR